MKTNLFPEGSFCIELTDEQGSKMFDLLDKKQIPFYYICDLGCVPCHCDDVSKTKVILSLCDKNWLASIDHLKSSKDGVVNRLITPENPDDGKPMPEFKDIFKIMRI